MKADQCICMELKQNLDVQPGTIKILQVFKMEMIMEVHACMQRPLENTEVKDVINNDEYFHELDGIPKLSTVMKQNLLSAHYTL